MKEKLLLFTAFLTLYLSFNINKCICRWVLMSNGLANSTYMGLAANTNTIFVIGMNGRVYLTTNNGTNWSMSLNLSGVYGYSLAVSE